MYPQDTYIFPLKDTFFEGTPAKIPFAYKEVLEAEYKTKALTLTEFEGYVAFLFFSCVFFSITFYGEVGGWIIRRNLSRFRVGSF